MPRIEIRPQARIDLVNTWTYIADDNPAQADAFLDRINELLRILALHPDMGRKREELSRELRSFSAGRYVIFYQPLTNRSGIIVVRVLHSSRDIHRGHFEE